MPGLFDEPSTSYVQVAVERGVDQFPEGLSYGVPARLIREDQAGGDSGKKKKEAFTLGQKIEARYDGGDFFDGKVKKVNSDGTYDIQYDDGDEEKGVKAE
jgi:hypothetical protein